MKAHSRFGIMALNLCKNGVYVDWSTIIGDTGMSPICHVSRIFFHSWSSMVKLITHKKGFCFIFRHQWSATSMVSLGGAKLEVSILLFQLKKGLVNFPSC